MRVSNRGSGQSIEIGHFVSFFRSRSESCTSLAELACLLGEAASELGFDHFAMLHHRAAKDTAAGLVRIDNYPEGWARRLAADPICREDPVHAASLMTSAGFTWAELPSLIAFGCDQRRAMEEAGRFGLGQGLTVPATIPGEPAASCSFAARAGARITADRLVSAEIVGGLAFKAARRLSCIAGRPRPHLSRRERQCLQLVAAGKTDWEISVILGIGLETVRAYVKRARSAYDAVSRSQLVALALGDRQIRCPLPIPPNG